MIVSPSGSPCTSIEAAAAAYFLCFSTSLFVFLPEEADERNLHDGERNRRTGKDGASKTFETGGDDASPRQDV